MYAKHGKGFIVAQPCRNCIWLLAACNSFLNVCTGGSEKSGTHVL